ncbi:MAG: hypothetical protein JO306_01280, partial [Gemmatimonadetes bacterium]|nr:hypothetical protein [Gemmatimonadota bacterium]
MRSRALSLALAALALASAAATAAAQANNTCSLVSQRGNWTSVGNPKSRVI